MTKRNALILYGSITGNTEMIGQAFADVCKEYNFDVDMVRIDPKHDWDENPVFVEEYDLIALGSPIIAGLPYKEVSMVVGLQGTKCLMGPKNMKKKMEESGGPGAGPGSDRGGIPGIVNPMVGSGTPGAKGEPGKTIYGVAFTTYGGSGCGPEECYGVLETLTELLRVQGARTVGKFACPGKELRHNSVDSLAEQFHINIDEAQALMQRYQDNPAAEEFTKYSPAQLATLKKHAEVKDEESFGQNVRMLGTNDPLGCGKPGSYMWHYDFDHRPTPRDITKAKIFMAEIIEDYFLTLSGDPRPPYSVYTTIS